MKKIFFLLIAFIFFLSVFPDRIYAATITACNTDKSADCIQLAVDQAKNGDTVLISKGIYKGDYFADFTEGQEQARVTRCFVNLKGKDITLQGEGNKESILFGEGHDRGDTEPIVSRAGICSVGGTVTLDNLRIKEFQMRCGVFINSRIIIKNSFIEGCDGGGISMINGSTGLFVNNFFVRTRGLLLTGKPVVKIINNIFYWSGVDYSIFGQGVDPPKAVITNNIFVDPEFTFGIRDGTQEQIQLLQQSTFSYNLIWKLNRPCYPPGEYCGDFSHKISADPMFVEPVTDERGIANWANFGFNDGSPAVGSGDPSIPGVKNLGINGGPCVNPADPTCSAFIRNNQPPEPVPIDLNPELPEPPPDNNNPPGNRNPFLIPLPLSRLIDRPNNYSLPNTNTTTKSISSEQGIFNLFMYIVFSLVYIMVMHFAINMGSEFSLGFMIVFFVLGGAIGGWLKTYESGFVVAAILSLIFISGPKKEM